MLFNRFTHQSYSGSGQVTKGKPSRIFAAAFYRPRALPAAEATATEPEGKGRKSRLQKNAAVASPEFSSALQIVHHRGQNK